MTEVMNVKQLTMEDYPALTKMDTGIEDDYVVRIFDRLVQSDMHELFGLFQSDQMLAIGGYSLFGDGKFAMLGRLRSDRRFQTKGNATELLKPIMERLKMNRRVNWIGANTHLGNLPARRVLEKLGIEQGPVIHYLILTRPDLLSGHTPGSIWEPVHDLKKKYRLLTQLNKNELGTFPYECYYPLPFDYSLFTDEYLNDSSFYESPDRSRFIIIKKDTKKYDYSHVKYFWNDHYEQPGFFETLLHHWNNHPDHIGCWIDFSDHGFKNIPELTAYDVQDPWILYGTWKTNRI
ncbi:Acetyltransferase (GNAT) family protein [Halobacillus karajensis]|uniref:GNAT family N-acetyltransferase n=1 Tax=Halobacillus karajensis TaxID=195088 RepID=UPI0008A72AD0|nr:GNAT family N-acetyltransferase [Halobacillus karajensis]SEH38793.1 Acetyltransferase (GNAT) family protein [Halobacillus karajensis]